MHPDFLYLLFLLLSQTAIMSKDGDAAGLFASLQHLPPNVNVSKVNAQKHPSSFPYRSHTRSCEGLLLLLICQAISSLSYMQSELFQSLIVLG